MEYRLGNSKKIKAYGNTINVKCPTCKKEGEFGVFSNYQRHLDSVEDLIGSKVYFLVCPNCADSFKIDGKSLRTVKDENGKAYAVLEGNLEKLEKFKPEKENED